MVKRYFTTVCAMGTLVLLAITPFVPRSSVQAQRQNQDQDAVIGTQSAPENAELRDLHRRPGHLLVRFKANASPSEVTSLTANRTVSENAALRITHLKVLPEEELAVFEQLKRNSAVEFVEFDSVVTTQFIPNDTYYATQYPSSHYGNIAQWGPQAVSAPAAWDITQGDPSAVIAIVDTGVDAAHPDLAAKIVGEYSFTGKVKDGFGHGTHCAGIAAAVTNDSVGVAGMCPNCKILSVKVLDDTGSGYMSDVASGIVYAADHGAEVISLSLGGSGRSETLRAALDYAVNHNALPVCAMGNSGTTSALEPAYWGSCLSVVAADSNGNKASFSTYGVRADVSAPGVGILSTMPTYSTYLSTHGYKPNYDALSGTSMATPMVAGLAGLVRSRNPGLTPTQTKGIIMATAGDGKSWSPELGFGLVNARLAVQAALHTDFTPPTVNLISPAPGATVSKLVTVQTAPTDNTLVHHIDFIRDGTRFIAPLVGVTTTSGSGKNAVTTQPWTRSWSSTLVFNGLVNITAFAVDSFGNASAPQNIALTVQNQLVSQNSTVHVCFPSTPSCPNVSPWVPVTTPVVTEAATHVQGTVTYLQSCRSPTVWVQVTNGKATYYCGTDGTTVDCFPSTTMLPPTSGRSGSLSSNYIGGQINCSGTKQSSGAEADINITLTYPQ
ncbi:MAG TPA: S8 family serine peptidase [Pyrinomonadaceae bacterium]|nr:S8 family serine peptidase [Pyrinomonadaceae bacterium]